MGRYIIKKIKFTEGQVEAINKAIDNQQVVTLDIDYAQLSKKGKYDIPFTRRQYNYLKVNGTAKLSFHLLQVKELAKNFDKEFEIDMLAFKYINC